MKKMFVVVCSAQSHGKKKYPLCELKVPLELECTADWPFKTILLRIYY